MANIESFIHRKVVVLRQTDEAQSAARAMCDRKVGCVIVADDEGHLVGLVTDRDLVCGILAHPTDARVSLSEVMTPQPVTVDEETPVERVIMLMGEHGVRRIPVIRSSRCVGIVTLDDLLAAKAISIDDVTRIVQAQIFRKKNALPRDTRSFRAQIRSEAHADQTLHRFFNTIAERTGLSEDRAIRLTTFLLGSIVRRLHYTGAAHLIAQLPSSLQEELLDLPAGPDRAISCESILAEMRRQFGYEEGEARTVMTKLVDSLRGPIDAGQWEHVRAQLPEDLRLLLGLEAEASHAA